MIILNLPLNISHRVKTHTRTFILFLLNIKEYYKIFRNHRKPKESIEIKRN